MTLVYENAPLCDIFAAIQQQSGYSLLYNNKLLKNERPVTIDVKNVSLEDALAASLQHTKLTWVITDRIIVIRKKTGEELLPVLAKISGKVVDDTGTPLPGASIMVREHGAGTLADKDGNFTLKNILHGPCTIEVSFIGFRTLKKKLQVSDSVLFVSLSLERDESSLAEFTVTALGIARKSRSLTYATEVVAGSDLTTVKNTNILNSLSGKVAGLQVNRTSGGAGGSVRMVLRGDKSTRNSQPLYVIDGLPVYNQVGGPSAGLYNEIPDAGDVISTLNPDDIESISLLKGASASALYGSQGSNGVVLITTKKGKNGGGRIDFSSSVTVEKAKILPKLQYDYLQTTPPTESSPGSDESWGAKGATQPDKDYVKDFFQTGLTFINSLGLQTGNEHSSNYLSYSNTDNKGILPTSRYKQHTLSFRQSSRLLNGRLHFDGTFIGAMQQAHNRINPGIYFNPLPGLYMFPRGQNFSDYKQFEYFSPARYLYAQNWWNINYDKDLANGGGWGGQDYQQNPYWTLHRNASENRNQNVYAAVSLKYILNTWLSVQARGNVSYFLNEYERRIHATTQATLARANGNYFSGRTNNRALYGDLLLTGERRLGSDWGVSFTAGTSVQDQQGKVTTIEGSPSVPNVFLESALERATIDIRNTATNRQLQSVFGSLQFSYRDKLYFDLSDRHDWSSTLAFTTTEGRGYNYYSAGLSAMLHEWIQLPPFINMAKVRASYAIVGNDIAPFSTYPLYTFLGGGVSSPPVSRPVVGVPGIELQPERNKSLEIGTHWKLFDNRLSLDVTWYKSNIIHQYFSGVSLLAGPGTLADINAGNIQNKGLEIMLSGKLIDRPDWNWTSTLNFYHNSNRVIELFDYGVVDYASNQQYRLTGGSGAEDGILKKGGAYGDIYGRGFRRDEQGRIVINSATGIPYYENGQYLGNPNPRISVGLKQDLRFRDFSFSFLIDGKFGGKVLSFTNAFLDQMGVSAETGRLRDEGGYMTIENAVDENGHPWQQKTPAREYFAQTSGKTPVMEQYMYSATAIRLREISFSCKLPFRRPALQQLQVGLTGSNLFFFLLDAPFDPEQVAGVNPVGVGVDVFGLPMSSSMGITLKYTH
ncbi:SusC/RagA family TonB-linked outer membrane protein [Chitinophaga cymbidii]|uniref:SusC/RagA family TonB-linked outer membrane protein n=1 Tax=Chitinophaga cymbidii TaxID=1096750 RepID=UPI00164A6AF5|nr:SusC/RagA family TonB-linked outer membrane protein [Chitinophaga cymbidii]